MTVLFLVGRILLGGYFLYNGINHFLNLGGMAQYAGMKGVPAPELAVLGTGQLLLVAGLEPRRVPVPGLHGAQRVSSLPSACRPVVSEGRAEHGSASAAAARAS